MSNTPEVCNTALNFNTSSGKIPPVSFHARGRSCPERPAHLAAGGDARMNPFSFSRGCSNLRRRKLGLSILVFAAAMTLASCGSGSQTAPPTTPVSSLGVQVSNGTLTVTTPSIQIAFQGSTVQSMKNLLTGETHIAAPGSGLIDLNTQSPTGELLQPGNWTTQSDPTTGLTTGTLSLMDSQRQITMTVGWDSNSDEVIVRLAGQSKKPGLRGLVWGIEGFNSAGKFILPAHTGLYFDANSPTPNFTFVYPTHWEAQFAVYQSSAGGLLLYARDPKPYYKQVQGTRQFGTLDISVETFALGPWAMATEVPAMEWRLKTFQGSWQRAVDTYSAWSRTAFPVRPPDSRRNWTKNIRAVIPVGSPDTGLLDAIAQQLDPSKTLIYLVGWRTSVLDANYPDYTPVPQTAPFVQYAHQLGFHVMLHTNIDGVSMTSAAYASLSQYQQRDPETGDLIYWPWGLWPAGPPPPPFLPSYAFISPAASAWRALFLQSIQNAMQTVQPDALHLDGGGVMLDDGNGLIEGMTTIDGVIQLHRDITNQYPQLALGYESMSEVVAGFQSFAQRWPAELPGHPVATYLMGNQVMFYAFLAQPSPEDAGFIEYVRHYEAQGVMPTITVAHANDLSSGLPITSRIVQMMKLWQQYDFQPDWKGDWTGLVFRYVSGDGSTTANVQQVANTLVLNAAGQAIYERALNTNSITTPLFISNWTAYDSTTLFGLDPTSQYWLQNDSRPTGSLQLAALPQGAELGRGTLDAGDYAYFELGTTPQPVYDFIASFGTAKIGIASANGLDFPLQSGAVAQVTQTFVNSKLESPVIILQPPNGAMLGGATFVEYTLPVPAASSILNFSAGISDFGALSQGVIFKAEINGNQVWRQQIMLGEWVPVQVDLSQWSGTTVKLRFLVLGVNLNPTDDLAALGDFSIVTTPPATPVSFSVIMPGASSAPTATSQLQLTPTSDPTTYKGAAKLPAQFTVFAKPPQSVNVGQSLLTLPFVVWKKSYGGFAFPAVEQASGSLGPVTSGGVVMNPALAVEPPDNGYSLITWSVQVPGSASLLAFSVGLADLPPAATFGYTGVGLSVLINGQTVWSQTVQTNGWNAYSVDLTPWRGQSVVVTLQADALGSALNDFSNWAGLIIQ